jgi:hypothetical protein
VLHLLLQCIHRHGMRVPEKQCWAEQQFQSLFLRMYCRWPRPALTVDTVIGESHEMINCMLLRSCG